MLFFNSKDTLAEVSIKIFDGLGIENFLEGDSSSYLNFTYYEAQISGIDIKISRNNYDYEDDYNFMISMKAPIADLINNQQNLQEIARIISSIISIKLKTIVAIEK